jgi:hypothetical protein
LKKNTLGNHGKTDRFQHVPKINRPAQKHGMQVCLKWLILKSLLGNKKKIVSVQKRKHFILLKSRNCLNRQHCEPTPATMLT